MQLWVISLLYSPLQRSWKGGWGYTGISLLLLDSSEVYPSALFTLNICHESRRSSASLQSSLPSFPKTTHVRIASSIIVDLWAKLAQNNSLPAALLTNRLQSHSSCYNEEFMCSSEWLECLSWSYPDSSHLHVTAFVFIIIYPIDNTAEKWPANFFSALWI